METIVNGLYIVFLSPYIMQDEKQGKMLLHTEHSLLSLLEGEEGVVQKHTSFVDTALQVYSFLVVKYHTKFNLQYLCKN